IVTNHHVVENAGKIKVRLWDERELQAKVVGVDEKTDLALIRVHAGKALPAATFGDSDKVEVGSWAIAIGNPFGFSATVTAGIISAKERVIGSGPYDNFLQTDAAINPGNSGGPLFNLEGEVIGINAAIISRTGGSLGIGFAIPINMAQGIVKQLKTHGKVTRGWLGVRIQTVTDELAQALGLGQKRGALVASVEKGSPAERAGVQSGDVIVRFDGKDIDRMNRLPAIVAATPKSKRIAMEVLRKGQIKHLSVVIASMKDDQEGEKRVVQAEESSDQVEQVFGMSLSALTPSLRERLRLPSDVDGVLVTDVDANGPAKAAGLRRRDVIQEINQVQMRSPADLKRVLKSKKRGKNLLVLILRDGDPLYLAFKLDGK
ncbi:Do family serine endopeptidase, partial [Magnetococcales bacterium HHB-1]